MINEAATDDARRHDTADTLLQACLKFLYNYEGDLPIVNLNGDEMPYVTGRMVFGQGIFGDLLITFFTDDRTYAGRAAKIDNDVFNYSVTIHVDGTTPREIFHSLSSPRIRATFHHEIQHILDYKRKKDKTPPKRDKETNEPKSSKDLAPYFNSPAELNAYFHNVAEPLLARINFIQKHGLEALKLYPDLPPTFREFFADRIAHLYGAHRMYWEHLTEENKRKVIKRLNNLYDFFNDIVQTLTKKEQTKYSETSEEINHNV